MEELGDKKKKKIERRESESRLRPHPKPLSYSVRKNFKELNELTSKEQRSIRYSLYERRFLNRSCHHAKET